MYSMSLPRISRRRRAALNETLPDALKTWVSNRDPFYLLAEPAQVIDRSIEIIRERPELWTAQDRLFCDLGFNNRKVFDRFYAALKPDFRWCGLELQDKLYAEAAAAAAEYAENPVEFLHAAACTFDGEIEIALDGQDDGYHPNDGSTTMLKLARDQSAARRRKAPAVDLARYLLDKSTPATRIVIKMDVEGAEYDLLPHLLKHPVMDRIDLILCEFHWRRFPFPESISKLFQTMKLVDQYRDRGSLLLSWR